MVGIGRTRSWLQRTQHQMNFLAFLHYRESIERRKMVVTWNKMELVRFTKHETACAKTFLSIFFRIQIVLWDFDVKNAAAFFCEELLVWIATVIGGISKIWHFKPSRFWVQVTNLEQLLLHLVVQVEVCRSNFTRKGSHPVDLERKILEFRWKSTVYTFMAV